MRFQAVILSTGKTATGIEVPVEVIASLGPSKKPPVRVTMNGYTYRSTVGSRGDRFLIGVSAENRERSGVVAGDKVDVDVELGTEPRSVTVPADLARALTARSSGLSCRSRAPRLPKPANDASRRLSRCFANAGHDELSSLSRNLTAARSGLSARCPVRKRGPRS
jgi:Domain of unknown function (DUF1905)